jgi:hypothetical protein
MEKKGDNVKVVDEILLIEKQLEYLVEINELKDISKHYLIIAANLFNEGEKELATERLTKVSEDYLQKDFYDDLLQAAKSKINLLTLVEAGAGAELNPDTDYEFIDALVMIEEQESSYIRDYIVGFYQAYKEIVLEHMRLQDTNTVLVALPVKE